jgi:hypothetical protein
MQSAQSVALSRLLLSIVSHIFEDALTSMVHVTSAANYTFVAAHNNNTMMATVY